MKPVSLPDIQESLLRTEEDRDTLVRFRDVNCESTGEIVKSESGAWLLIGAQYEGKLCDLELKDDGTAEIKNSYRTTGRTRGKAKQYLAANDNRPAAPYPGVKSSGEFIRGFSPPDYHLDGVSQKGFLYSTTAMTGTGKTAVLLLLAALTMLGKPLGDREIGKGRVVYFAGENPDDVRMRWIAMAHHLDFDPDCVNVHFIAGAFGVAEMFQRIKADVEKIGGADMIVVDTSAAYFNGDDENSNTQLGAHARNLRALTTLPGKPVVYAACHPVKNPDPSNLLPRGGGAFIAEVDGNLTLNKGETVRLHWQGKHRGPDFEPIHFELRTVTAPSLVDSKGRPVPTVMAEALTKSETVKRAVKARSDDDEVLLAINHNKGASLAELAESPNWHTPMAIPTRGGFDAAVCDLSRIR
jgi:hypothetical protein